MIFEYKVYDEDMVLLDGKIEAENPSAAEQRLRDRGFRIVTLKTQSIWKRDLLANRKFSAEDLSVFFLQLSYMTEGGMDVGAVFGLMANQSRGRKKEKLQAIYERLQQGAMLSAAFAEAGGFPAFVPGMIRSGETAGTLSMVYRELGAYFHKESEMQKRLLNALAYPAVLLVTAIFVLRIVLSAILPVFLEVFQSQNAVLPPATRLLLGISEHMASYGSYYIAAMALLCLGVLLFASAEKTKLLFRKWLYHFPPCVIFTQKPFILRFLRSMKMQADSGVDVLSILKNAEESIVDVYIRDRLSEISRQLTAGKRLSAAMKEASLFPAEVSEFVAIGEASSKLSEMLHVLILMEESRQEYRMRRFAVYIEPAMILMMACIVGFIVFAVAVPMFDMVNSF